MAEEKPHAPTPRRRERAREAGQFPRGRDLTGIAVVLTGIAALLCCGPWWFRSLGQLWTSLLPASPHISLNAEVAVSDFRNTLGLVSAVVLPAMGLFFAVAVVTQWAQVGWNWLPGRIAPDFSRVNPFARLAAPAGLFRWSDGLLVIVRYLVGLGVGITSLWLLRQWTGWTDAETTTLMFGRAAQTGVAIVFHAVVGLAVVSILEYGYRWWRFEADLRMTSAEAREDAREQEGDLRIRSLRRDVHQQMARRRGEERADIGA